MTVMTPCALNPRASSQRHHPPGESAQEDVDLEDDGLSLPIEPDEGTTLIPDDERVVNIPS